MAEAIIDARGQQCPIPVVKANKALSEMKEPGTLEVHVDNETAVANLLKLAGSKGLQAKSHMKDENHYVVEIEGNGGEGASAEAEDPKCGLGAGISGDTIAVISSDRMGEGNDELGRVLMKGFIYALSQLEKLPETILFYNGGATITCTLNPWGSRASRYSPAERASIITVLRRSWQWEPSPICTL